MCVVKEKTLSEESGQSYRPKQSDENSRPLRNQVAASIASRNVRGVAEGYKSVYA